MQILSQPFSHIYVEKEILDHPRTIRILDYFLKGWEKEYIQEEKSTGKDKSTEKDGNSSRGTDKKNCQKTVGKQNRQIIEISHYKDVFCRKKQDVFLQNQAPMLILAKRRENFLYSGSPVCQSFDERYFYYTSCVMNCLYDCEYCYLKGMYPSGNLVIFVNIEDTFSEVEKVLQEHEVYLCISYDSDLMAVENLTGFVGAWSEFAAEHKNLKIECRTKCGRTDLWKTLHPGSNMIFAFTISPERVIRNYEHRTSSFFDRLSCITEAMKMGFPVRLCFDPMIYLPEWKREYEQMLREVKKRIPMERLYDVSVGSFRISQDYLKKMRHVLPDSAVVQFPFENERGVYHYPKVLMEEMEGFLKEELKKELPEEKIFLWN
ncbi:MAG: radical SAM protein [Lachnospiraceae bacterium]|nr:radical SAM protein [Lachnospiraceae bacterium]